MATEFSTAFQAALQNAKPATLPKSARARLLKTIQKAISNSSSKES